MGASSGTPRRLATAIAEAQRLPAGFLLVTSVISAGSKTSRLCVIGVVSTYCARVQHRRGGLGVLDLVVRQAGGL